MTEILVELKHHSVTADEVLNAKSIPDDIGLDSLETIELLLHLEREFGIHVDFDNFTIDHLQSVASLTQYVNTMLTNSGKPPLATA